MGSSQIHRGLHFQTTCHPFSSRTVTYHSIDDDGYLSMTYILDNAAEHQQALVDAQPWMIENNIALSHIITALPQSPTPSSAQGQVCQTSLEKPTLDLP